MYDITGDLHVFYEKHVRLSQELRAQLAGYRDSNIERIKGGLDDLSKDSGRSYAYPYEYKNQGGYAMHTLNQAQDNDYDIDVALLFRKEGLPEDPLSARQRICDALLKRAGNFSKDPEARTNAVTVWYQEGYHIDFAIYRTWVDFWGTLHTEHASTEWTQRDPMEINNWFMKQVADKSPKAGFLYEPRVAAGQLRRIVRFVKWYCRSRSSWCLPGGMITSALVAEVYRADPDRDDVALYNTLVALSDRLRFSTRVSNPVNSQELTAKDETRKQVERLRDKLPNTLERLSVLFDGQCTRDKARSAWDWVFNHEYWAKKESSEEKSAAPLPYSVKIQCGLARKNGGTTYKIYPSSSFLLPKGIHLKFSVVTTDLSEPYNVRWIVDNEGDEAKEENQQHWEKIGRTCWTSTKFKGRQQMTCELERNGQVLARARHLVKISANGRWGAI